MAPTLGPLVHTAGGLHKKVQIGNDQEMAQPERNSRSINRGAGKN